MRSIFLIIDQLSLWSPISWLKSNTDSSSFFEEMLLVHDNSGWCSIRENNEATVDFDCNELEKLFKIVGFDPIFYYIEWSWGGGEKIIDRLVMAIPENVRAAVDNDHGLLISIHQIKKIPFISWYSLSDFP